jgi:protein required for attachment to host cells
VAPSRELVTDRPGRGKRPGGTGSGEGRHQKGPGTDPHRHEKARFAHTVAEAVEGQRTRSRLDSLLVVAPPKMLGDLRNEFSDEVRSLVREEIPKDLANLKPAEIEDHFPEIFPRGA